jgi:hypothetical protein
MTTRMLDAHTYIGSYPFRHLPHPDPDALVRVLDREGIGAAWVAHLPSAFYRDPTPGTAALHTALAGYRDRLHPVPTIRPDWPGWNDSFERAVALGAPAVRAYPPLWGMAPGNAALASLATACAAAGVALTLPVRFEDPRQRHPLDVAGDLPAATIRELARVGTNARIVVLAAGRALIEEVHWGLTESERKRVVWDISWIWGPPEDDLAHLLTTIGAAHFTYGSGWPLRLAQTPRANLALLPGELATVRLADLAVG